MFSISTMASSTRMPITRVSPSSVTMFRLNPITSMKKKVGISETGMAMAVISVARQSRRNTNTTSAASSMPSSSVCQVAMKPARVWSTRERILVIDTPGCWLRATFRWPPTPFSRVISLASLTLADLESDHRLTVEQRERAHLCGAVTYSATSEAAPIRPPPVGMAMLRICSTVTAAPRIRSVCSRPPTSTRPPGASRLRDRKRLVHVVGGESLRRHSIRIHDDVDLAIHAAHPSDLRNAGCGLQRAGDGVFDEPRQFLRRHGRARKRRR